MTRSYLAVIGGTGLETLPGLEVKARQVVETPWGPPSGPLVHGTLHGRLVTFLSRHGEGHTIAPHRVNYRANIWALREHASNRVMAVAAVGGIDALIAPGAICIPDQIIDYTWSRDTTFFDPSHGEVVHIDFTQPYCEKLRDEMLLAASRAGIEVTPTGTYAAVQGPRLETAAEVRRLQRDGCHIVGMTGMPEACLARELELCYATCAVCANAAAGLGPGVITMDEIRATLVNGMADVGRLIGALLAV